MCIFIHTYFFVGFSGADAVKRTNCELPFLGAIRAVIVPSGERVALSFAISSLSITSITSARSDPERLRM